MSLVFGEYPEKILLFYINIDFILRNIAVMRYSVFGILNNFETLLANFIVMCHNIKESIYF